MKKECDVFISYARKDYYLNNKKEVNPDSPVLKIKNALENAKINYFLDESIHVGENYINRISDAIVASKVFLFLSTESSNKSSWTIREVSLAVDENKHILPVKLDNTKYSKGIHLLIANLNYIEYFNNPEYSLTELVDSINGTLRQIKDKEEARKELERKKAEELENKKKEERRIIQEKQKQLFKKINLTCKALNNEEEKLEIQRENLINETEGISDNEQRERLIKFISEGGPIHLKYRERITELVKNIENLNNELQSAKEEREAELARHNETTTNLNKRIFNLKSQFNAEQEKHVKDIIKQGIAFSVPIAIVLIFATWIFFYNSIGKDYRQKIEKISIEKDSIMSDYALLLEKNKDLQNQNKSILASIMGQSDSVIILKTPENIKLKTNKKTYNLPSKKKTNTLPSNLKINKDTITLPSNLKTNKETYNHPFVITDIEVRNSNENWGDSIYSNKCHTFYYRLEYYGIIVPGKHDVYIKIYDNNGVLCANKNDSPSGYTWEFEIDLKAGTNYSKDCSWGWKDKTLRWPAGTYRIEVWYKNKKIAEKKFRIY